MTCKAFYSFLFSLANWGSFWKTSSLTKFRRIQARNNTTMRLRRNKEKWERMAYPISALGLSKLSHAFYSILIKTWFRNVTKDTWNSAAIYPLSHWKASCNCCKGNIPKRNLQCSFEKEVMERRKPEKSKFVLVEKLETCRRLSSTLFKLW